MMCSASLTDLKNGWRSAVKRERRRSGSYSNKPSNKSKNWWCSSESHDTHLWHTDRERALIFCVVHYIIKASCVLTLRGLQCSRTYRPADVSSLQSNWPLEKYFCFLRVKVNHSHTRISPSCHVQSGSWPCFSNHSGGNWSVYSLHHGQMFSVIMSLKTNTYTSYHSSVSFNT